MAGGLFVMKHGFEKRENPPPFESRVQQFFVKEKKIKRKVCPTASMASNLVVER